MNHFLAPSPNFTRSIRQTSTSSLLPQTSLEAADRPPSKDCLTGLSKFYLPTSDTTSCMKGMVSNMPWKPIFNVRTRPLLVQTIAFHFLRNLQDLRSGPAALPKLDSINLPSDRQFVVSFGDLDSLLDCIVSASLSRPAVAAAMKPILT